MKDNLKRNQLKLAAFALSTGLLLGQTSYAGDWSGYADVSGLAGGYSGTTTRTAISSFGASLNLDYLDQGGMKVSGSQVTVADTGNNLYQQSAFISAYVNKYNDTLGGVLRFRLDAHQVDLSDDFTYQDNVRAYAGQVSFINYQKSLYVDLGLTQSTYNSGLKVNQLTPTFGFSFNQGSDWLQTRGYFINTSDAALAQGVSSSQAIEMKLTHWTAPGSIFSQLFANALLGERVFAVDGDAATIYSLADTQQGGGSIGLAWQSQILDGIIMLAADSYINKTNNTSYINSFAYISVSKSW